MIEVNTVVLENGVEYTEVDELMYKSTRYVLLCNVKNAKDSCIRKIEVENNEEYFCRLDSENEFNVVLDLFVEKNKTLFS